MTVHTGRGFACINYRDEVGLPPNRSRGLGRPD